MSRSARLHADGKMRCPWPGEDPFYVAYHDNEWGVPLYDDRKLFEFLVLQGMQAGLSWSTILNKRENFRAAFSNFDARTVAQYDAKDIRRLMKDAGIIRNRLKIMAAINNSKRFLDVQKEFDSFSNYIWAFVDNKPVTNKLKSFREMPARTELSDKISGDLRKRGFSFIGSTIIYAHMQATGMVNDHLVSCPRWKEIAQMT